MLDNIINLFKSRLIQKTDNSGLPIKSVDEELKTSLAVLLFDIAYASDDLISDQEREKIKEIIKNFYDIDKKDADDILQQAEKKLTERVDIYHFTRQINEHYSQKDKENILKSLYQIIYLDNKFDDQEYHLLNKIARLLKIDHKTIIAKKIEVKSKRLPHKG